LSIISDKNPIAESFRRQSARLGALPAIPAALLFIPFFSVTLLTLFVGFESSLRSSSRIEPFVHESAPASDHALWMSVGIRESGVRINTAAGETFQWSPDGPSKKDYEAFERHIISWSKRHVQNIVRSGQINSDTNMAVIAIDQKLTYHHIRPVIYALAAAGVSKYGFETKLPQKAEAGEQ
jgi:hypothetical protein